MIYITFDRHILNGLIACGVSARELTDGSMTILYSFCLFEICGMYAAVSCFYNRRVPVCISQPPTSGGVRNVINYGNCVPEEILRGAEKARLLSDMEKAAIHKRWVQLTARQSNLRIWNGGDVENVCDEYYDADIQSAMVVYAIGRTADAHSDLASEQIQNRPKSEIF